jgi:hypothetical protein
MAKRNQASEGNINHYHAVRLRVVGSGSLQMRFLSLDEIDQSVLVPLTMATTSAREPTRLASFKSQRAQLEIKTTEIDERFRISKIIIYAKAVETSFPG